MQLLGLVGRNISYSFSRSYFQEKFKTLNLEKEFSYQNFDLQNLDLFSSTIKKNPQLLGCNITTPYKQDIIPLLDVVDAVSKEIGAVNTIKIQEGKLYGYNTDVYGFEESIKPLLSTRKKALILGTGGASKAIEFVLNKLDISYIFVSRTKTNSNFTYEEIDAKILQEFEIIINCSPIGTFPNINLKPDLPYDFISEKHLLYDLVYNPEETSFLKEGKKRGAKIKNGYEMLVLQAEKSWEIWTL